jgi:hypothetical protein
MNVIRRYSTANDDHASRFTRLSDQVARTLCYPSAHDLVPVLHDPYEVVFDIEDRVRASSVLVHPSILATELESERKTA